MIKVYEIKANGFLGASKDIDPKEGIGGGWTYTPPPSPTGSYKWLDSQWVSYDEPSVGIISPDLDKLSAEVRAERNKRLSETDWRFRMDMNPSQEWVDYCQALRDITDQEGFPLSIEWPVQPV